MRLTKLQIVQHILTKIDSDEVTDLNETIESEQVSDIIDGAYAELLDEQPWPHLRDIRTLEVTTVAHTMKIPTDVVTVDTVRYNGNLITYLDPSDMWEILSKRQQSSNSNIDVNGAVNDTDPIYWTSFDDVNIVFDAYNSSLVSSLTSVDCYKLPAQMTTGSEYPDLPPRFHQVLLNWALADAFYTLKGDQIGYNIYRKRAKTGLINMQRWAKKVNKIPSTGANVIYGRKRLS